MIVVSINVHEHPAFIQKQLTNIHTFLKVDHIVLLNCNDSMLKELKSRDLGDRVILNPISINKRRFHGSLTQGIISNMELAMKVLSNFDMFLVMSSREMFYQTLYQSSDIIKHVEAYEKRSKNVNLDTWHWRIFEKTKLFQYIIANDMYLCSSAHEGMCFDYESCLHILRFLNEHDDIKTNLFHFSHCVEEFALQSICANYKPFFYIGNGCGTFSVSQCKPSKFTHKVYRTLS